jgi:hypothetical protein
MFSVLVIVLRSDDISGPGFFLGEREISLIASLCACGSVRFGAVGIRCPPLRAGTRRRAWFEVACCFSSVLHDSIIGRKMAVGSSPGKKPQSQRRNGLVIPEDHCG